MGSANSKEGGRSWGSLNKATKVNSTNESAFTWFDILNLFNICYEIYKSSTFCLSNIH